MKRSFTSRISLLLIATVIAGNLFSQDHKIEITPFGGYLLGGSVKFYEGKLKINDNACYGGMLALQVSSGVFVEVSYTGMMTTAEWRPYYDYSIEFPEKSADVSVNYLQIGSVKEVYLDNDKIRPYGTASLGTTWFHSSEENTDDEWLFSVAAGAGMKFFFTDNIGIRIQARLLLPLVYNGAGFAIGTGGGGVYVSSSAPIVQGDFTGGLIIALGNY